MIPYKRAALVSRCKAHDHNATLTFERPNALFSMSLSGENEAPVMAGLVRAAPIALCLWLGMFGIVALLL